MMSFAKLGLIAVLDALRREIRWVTVNLIGMLVPILFEVWLMTPRSEIDSLNGIDVLGAWIIKVFPFLVAIFIVNVIWLIQVWRRNRGLSRRRSVGTWLVVCCLWLVPLCLNPVALRMLWLVTGIIDGQAWAH